MRRPIRTTVLALAAMAATTGLAQPPPRSRDPQQPAPGTRGNPDNVPFIGRRDPKGNPVRLAKATGHVSNYSEERVRPYTLPDPLVMASGERVTNADQWFKVRRPEILKLYRDEIYGRVPAGAPRVTWEVAGTDTAARGGTAVMKRVAGRMGVRPDGPRMNLIVYLPAKGERAGSGAPEHHLRFRPGRAPSSGREDRTAPGRRAGQGGVHEIGRRERARPRRIRSRGGGARPRLGIRLAALQRDPAGPRRPMEGRRDRTDAEGRGRRDPLPMNGGPSAPGRGASAGRSTTWKATRPSTPGGSPSPASRGWARPSCGPAPRTSAWRPCSRSSPARWALP